MENEAEKMLIDVQREYTKSNRKKDKIIILLIVLMFFEAVVGYTGFIWYESQFDYIETDKAVETKNVDIGTEGDNASAEYNDVNGNQYNDNAVHKEGGDK